MVAALADTDIRTRIPHDLGLPAEQAAVERFSRSSTSETFVPTTDAFEQSPRKASTNSQRIRDSLNLDPENPSQSENLNLLYNLMTSLVNIEETSLGLSEFKSGWLLLAKNKDQETLGQMGFEKLEIHARLARPQVTSATKSQ